MAYSNGLIPVSALTPLSVGGHLLAIPARAFEEWRRQAAAAGRDLTITSAADAYRPLAVQVRVFLDRYIKQASGDGIYGDVRWWAGVRYVRRHGAAAAVPGTSNHGRGLAVDIANAGPFGGPFHDWLLATGPALGWSNAEGRSVNEPWHWVHNGVTLANSSTDKSTGLTSGSTITAPNITDLPAHLQEAIMAGPIRMRLGQGIRHVDVSTGTDIPVPNTEYDAIVAKAFDVPLVQVNQREADVIRDFCSRIRDQRNTEIADKIKKG